MSEIVIEPTDATPFIGMGALGADARAGHRDEGVTLVFRRGDRPDHGT